MSHQTRYRSYRGQVFMGQMTQPIDPRAVAVSRYGWLKTSYGWLAG